MLTKNLFDFLFPLIKKQPWLGNKEKALKILLTGDCKNEGDQGLILDLLNRFTYLTQEKFQESLNAFISTITSLSELSQDNTQFVATTIDSNSDSAQLVLYSIKPILQENGWDNPKLINNSNKIVKNIKTHPNVIFLDEFIGTGKTMIGRINKLKDNLSGMKVTEYKIIVYAVACTYEGKNKVLEKGIPLHTSVLLGKGISDHYDSETVHVEINRMKEMESILSDTYNGRNMPSMGYGGVEALYVRENGNTPNNVFPVFWWAYYKDNSKRSTVLVRSMGDA